MLDEHEFHRLRSLYIEVTKTGKDSALERPVCDFTPVIDEYERMTGIRVEHAKTALEHRLAAYGPDCTACGKPLRTPEAAMCIACGARRS